MEDPDPAKPRSIWDKLKRLIAISIVTLMFGAAFGALLFGTAMKEDQSFLPFWAGGTAAVALIVLLEYKISSRAKITDARK